MKANTKAKVTACLLTMMAPTIASHAAEGIQMTDWSMMREVPSKSKVVVRPAGISCSATKGSEVVTAAGLTELLRQLGYSRDEMWGKQDRLAFAWYRINNAKFKRGESVEFEGRIFKKSI